MYKPNEDFLTNLTREVVLEWLAGDRNEIDWTLEHVDVNVHDLDDEAREAIYHSVRDRFIKVLVEGQSLDDLPLGSLAILRVTAAELENYYPMEPDTYNYVDSMLETGAPPKPTLTYKATGKKAMVAGLLTGVVLGLGLVALIRTARK